MGSVTVSNGRIIPEMQLDVYVNGSYRRDVDCYTINRAWGANPSTAEFGVPRYYIENGVGEFDDAEIVVYARTGAQITSTPIFRGFVVSDDRTESAGGSVIRLQAISILGLLDRVYVGQLDGAAVWTYPRKDINGNLTGWTFSRILEDMFSPARLASQWRAKVGIGNTFVLSSSQVDLRTPNVVFPTTNYREALRYLLKLAGQIGMRERFTNGKTLLDFYVFNDDSAPARAIQCPTSSIGPEDGAFVVEIGTRRDSTGTRNRVIGYGRNREIQLTITSNPNASLGEPMTPAWANASSYSDLTVAPADADETSVLANPDRAIRGRPAYDPALEYVFRRFRLPESIRLNHILDNNVVVDSEGRRLAVQFFAQTYTYTGVGSGGVDFTGSISATQYRLISGATITPDGFVVFPEPVVAPYQYTYDETTKERGITYRRVHAAVTLSIAQRDKVLRYDTGIRGRMNFPGLEAVGMVSSFRNPTLTQSQNGTFEDQLYNLAGDTFTYGSLYYDAESDTWQVLDDPGTPGIVENDLEFLAALCEGAVRERRARATEAMVRMPGIWNSFQVGDVISIRNRGINNHRLQIDGITYDLYSHSTTIRASDAAPQFVNVEMRRPRSMDPRGLSAQAKKGLSTATQQDAPVVGPVQGPAYRPGMTRPTDMAGRNYRESIR